MTTTIKQNIKEYAGPITAGYIAGAITTLPTAGAVFLTKTREFNEIFEGGLAVSGAAITVAGGAGCLGLFLHLEKKAQRNLIHIFRDFAFTGALITGVTSMCAGVTYAIGEENANKAFNDNACADMIIHDESGPGVTLPVGYTCAPAPK